MIIGIDYSLTSPSICLHPGDEWDYNNCKFFFLTDSKKYEFVSPNIQGELHKEWKTPEERYHNISSWALDVINKHNGNNIFLEGYAFAATGRIFQIAENTGILKDRLWRNKLRTEVVPPTVVKKFATGKGNANKELMQQTFLRDTGIDVKKILGQTAKQWNPSSDIIDSYYICKYGYTQS
jgi:Holliday junction resolvasome RuvABC endonuclease subunit